MKTSDKGIKFIKSFESFCALPYFCAGNKSTIGYGHAIKPGEDLKNISEDVAATILANDLKSAEISVSRNIVVPLRQSQFDALVSFVFNLGGGALQRSGLRQKINYGSDDNEIYEEFIRWIYAGGKKLTGLLRRREAEAAMYLG